MIPLQQGMPQSLPQGTGGMLAPQMDTGGDLGGMPLATLGQLAQSGNPGVKAAALIEIAKRGSPSQGMASLAKAANSSDDPMLSGGNSFTPGQTAPQGQQASSPLGQPMGQTSPATGQPPNQGAPNPGMNAIASGASAAANVSGATPNSAALPTMSGLPAPTVNPGLKVAAPLGQSSANANPGLASIGALMPVSNDDPQAGAPTFDIHSSVTPKDQALALARGFFTMASSKQPGFLGALGEGGSAATDALTRAQDRAQQGAEFGVGAAQNQQQIDAVSQDRAQKIAQQQQQLLAVRQAVAALPKEQQAMALADPEGFFGAQFKAMFDNGDVPASIQEYQYAVKNGYKGTPAQFWDEQKRASSGSNNINVNLPKSINAGDEELMKTGADAYQQAQEILPLFGIARQSAKNFPNSGPLGKGALLVERGKSMFGLPNNASSGEVLQGMQTRLGTLMRVPGSGATSDMEMSLYMQGVPSLLNTQQGNVALADIGEKLMKRRMENYRAMQAFIAKNGSSVGYVPNDKPVLTQSETNLLESGADAPPDSTDQEAPPASDAALGSGTPPAGSPAGTAKAPDGNWYAPDKNSPSGWSKVVPQ